VVRKFRSGEEAKHPARRQTGYLRQLAPPKRHALPAVVAALDLGDYARLFQLLQLGKMNARRQYILSNQPELTLRFSENRSKRRQFMDLGAELVFPIFFEASFFFK
jgi:hypothetical protein